MGFDEDDMPVLSGAAFAALQDFYADRDKQLADFEQLQFDPDEDVSISDFKEDWNTSQFWFTDSTAAFLARQLLEDATPDSAIAVVSAPSVFLQLKKILATEDYPQPARVCLLEYDDRFKLLDGYAHFDFHVPTDLPSDLEHGFDRILCDPPYHNKECIIKYAETVEWLSRDDRRTNMICTGENMFETVLDSFTGLKETSFKPEHSVRLDNKYACFANCDLIQ